MNEMQYPEQVGKYLKKYGLEKWSLEISKPDLFQNIIVIPAISEFENIKILLSSLRSSSDKYFCDSLFVFVINNTESVSDDVKEDNKKALAYLRKLILSKDLDNEGISVSDLHLGVVDASSPGLELDEKNGGVGLARKIGMDLALKHFNYSSDNKNILVCLDADCTVSSNYLNAIVDSFNLNKSNAGYIRYEHRWDKDDKFAEAIVCYEIFLRYYVLALKYAKSPYAIHTIGSTLICDHEAYINVEGMNKRKAAEDFYFIEKLAKRYDLKEIRDAAVYPSGRGSWRVPFGTGQRVNRFLSHQQNEYLLYSPESFKILKNWNNVYYDDANINSAGLLKLANDISKHLHDFLQQQSFGVQWNKIDANSSSREQLRKQKKLWFDGFRTLKLIHYLRDTSYPNIDMFSALNQLLKIMDEKFESERTDDSIPDFSGQVDYLNRLRELT